MSGRSPFERAVATVVKAIPRGQTLSYSGVALRANRPGAARAVVRALHGLTGIPWWRVIRADGTLAPEVALEQARRLRAEGVRLARGERLRVDASARALWPRQAAPTRPVRPAARR